MQSKNLPNHIYIKETNGKYEFFDYGASLTRKQHHSYKFYLKRTWDNAYVLFAKDHAHGQFYIIDYEPGLKRTLTKEFKAYLILYGFNLPDEENRSHGPCFTLR